MAIANILGIDTSYATGSADDSNSPSEQSPSDILAGLTKESKPGAFVPLIPPRSTSPEKKSIIGDDKASPLINSPSMPALLCSRDGTAQTDSVVNECITLVVNGLQLMRVRLPKHEAGASSKGTMHILPSTLKARADTMHQCDARLTPVSLLVSGLNIALPRDSCVKSSVRFTGEGHEHDVSFKDLYTRMESDLVNDVVGFIPTHVTLHLKYHATCVVRDEEQEVLEALREIIADEKVNPRGGSITSALANDILKEKLPKLYEFVIRRKHGNLENFLNAHQDVFTLFTFSDKALKKKTVSPEPRIVLKAGQRELCTNLPMSNAEIRLHEYLHTILGPKDMDKRDLLDQLSNDMTFATFLSPTLSILMRFLSRHKDQFVWSMDPDKPTVVGLQGRQHDSACLGQQADLDKQMPHPANKKYPGKGEAQDGQQDRGVPRDYEMARGGKDGAGKGKGKGSKGKGGRGAKGGGLGMDDAWQQGNKGGFGQRDLGHGAGFVMNSAIAAQGNQMLNGTQVINGQYQYQQQQPQNQFVVMQGQQSQFAPQFLYESPMKQQAQVQAQAQAQAQLMPDDMSMLDMIGNDSFDQLYRQGSQPELVPTSDGSFLFVEQGQERQQQAQQQQAQAQQQQAQTQAQAQTQQSGAVPETVFLHEVRFVNGAPGPQQISPAQQPLLMQGSAPLFAQQVAPSRQTTFAQSALPFAAPVAQHTGGVGT